MDDRGEKIINLAREMLRSDMVLPEPASKTSVSLKMLCLATVLSAASGSLATEALAGHHRPINRYERTELKALVFYAAHLKGLKEDDIRREVEEKFSLDNIDEMSVTDFQDARAYLQRKVQ